MDGQGSIIGVVAGILVEWGFGAGIGGVIELWFADLTKEWALNRRGGEAY